MKVNYEAEQNVIGSILLKPEMLNHPVVRSLVPEDFDYLPYRNIFQTAVEMAAAGEKVDAFTVIDKAKADPKMVADAMELTPTANNADAYARIVIEERQRSQLALIGEDLTDVTAPVAEIASKARTAIDEVMDRTTGDKGADGKKRIQRLVDWRSRMDSGKVVIPSGYRNLDMMLGGGFMAGGLYVVGARPAMGKTVFGLNLARRMDKQGVGLIFSLEMTTEQIEARMLAEQSGLPSNVFLMKKTDKLTDDEKIKFGRATSEDMKSRSIVYDKVFSLNGIQFVAEGYKDLAYIVIDYLGLLQLPSGNASRYEKMTELSGQVKRMAKKLNVPVILLAQLNREVTGRKDNKPQLSDLRDTGAIEQDADAVILLHRDDYYSGEVLDEYAPSELQAIVAKNRYGRTGVCQFAFYTRSGRIVENETKRGS